MGVEEVVIALIFVLLLSALVVVYDGEAWRDYSAVCIYWGVDFLGILCGPGHPYH